jgi:hypothetical protein
LLLANAMKAEVIRGKKQQPWKPTFWPDDYVKGGHDMTVKGNTLAESKLKEYGIKVTKFRTTQRERALKHMKISGEDADGYLRTTEALARSMHKAGYFR